MNIVTCFARIAGETVGIVANQPKEKAGSIDINGAKKAARFIRFCDCFNIPIISFVDTPGFLPGADQEHGNIIQNGAKLIYAYGEATVPKITIILRKAYGGAYISMGSKALKADVVYAWPMAEIAVLGSEAAGQILFKNVDEETKKAKVQEYEDKYINAYFGASRAHVDEIIEPSETRSLIYKALILLKDKCQPNAKKHSNMPL